jgi:CubicO group peptidase (beta-lactamase class C family)
MPARLCFALTILLLVFATPGHAQEFGGSVAVHFDARHIGMTEAHGVADPFTERALTAYDPARIASVSKLAAALGVMRLVDVGLLDLDRDVSDWLGWKLRNPAFPDTPVTLRLLLSHQSSLTDGIDYALPLGTSLKAALADSKAWDSAHPSGTWFHYSNLNFPVIASIMEAATHERFDRLMARLVFTPLKLDACFNWSTCSDAAVARAVVLTDSEGIVRRDNLQEKRPACPVIPDASGGCDLSAYQPGTNGALFSPQGGMRISARDLARIGQMLARRGRGFLSARSFRALTSPQWRFNGHNGETESGFFCGYGLAVQTLANRQNGCRDEPFGDGRARIGHAGEAYGLRSGLWLDPKTGKGIAFFVTAIADDAPKGRSAFTSAEEAVLQGSPAPPHR